MDYTHPSACLDLLQRLHPIDFKATHQTLVQIVRGLLEGRPAPNQHLEVLEAARDTLSFAQGEMARRYAAHPLPPDSEENATLGRVIALWQDMARSYARIADADASEGTLEDQRALLMQRRILYEGLALIEYFRAHRALEPGMWRTLHSSYASALEQGLARIRVSEPLNETWRAQSPHEAYVAILLVDLANPYGRSERELGWIVRWAQRFAPYCAVDAELESSKSTTYGVDFELDQGLRPLGLLARTPSLMRFDGAALATQIQAVMAQFKRGVKPASLGLGEDCSTGDAGRLLLSLYRPWGLAAAGRRFPRRSRAGEVELTGDWLGMGFAIQGALFQQPRTASPHRPRADDIALLTFRERATLVSDPQRELQRRKEQAEMLGLECERWGLLDQSVGGFRLQRRSDTSRLEHHQLIAIRPPDGEQFLLGDLSWLIYRAEGTLEIGVNVLPGIPRVLAIRQTSNGSREPYHQAFLLPASPALKSDASLVLPAQWFRRGRMLELWQDGVARKIELTKLLLRGANFDQCSFDEVAPNPA